MHGAVVMTGNGGSGMAARTAAPESCVWMVVQRLTRIPEVVPERMAERGLTGKSSQARKDGAWVISGTRDGFRELTQQFDVHSWGRLNKGALGEEGFSQFMVRGMLLVLGDKMLVLSSRMHNLICRV